MITAIAISLILLGAAGEEPEWPTWESFGPSVLDPDYKPRNLVPPLVPLGEAKDLPIKVAPYDVHVNGGLIALPNNAPAEAVVAGRQTITVGSGINTYEFDGTTWADPLISKLSPTTERIAPAILMHFIEHPDGIEVLGWLNKIPEARITCQAKSGLTWWIGTDKGLYASENGSDPVLHPAYGDGGPLATTITALALDSTGELWVGTPLGLSVRDAQGGWRHIQGREGLPVEDVTSIAIDGDDNLWIGTTHGVIHYRPEDEVRQWYYRAGPRYLADDKVNGIAVSEDGRTVYAATPKGVSVIKVEEETLRGKADHIEDLVNLRHRREGMVADCDFPDPSDLTKFTIGDNDNDGLWTAYHVTALSLAYGTTKDPAHKASAREGMHSLYLLQNASGIPGITARSVVPPEEGLRKREQAKDRPRLDQREQWRPTPDGKFYWKSDTSSDEYCGHYMAFYAYWEHVAKDDPAERDLCIKQVRQVTDYLLNNNYQLIDWDGERTTWGFWNPEIINGDPGHYVENGLNALQISSFLKTTYYITGDEKYQEHYLKLLQEHDYLSNILLEKKIFPDETNHSDDQLGFTAWYPILQIEQDPKIRFALHSAVRRHWTVEEPERPSYFTFIYATIDPNHADIDGAIRNLQGITKDRRSWEMKNSHRADVSFSPRPNRFGRPVLTEALPADERDFQKWNGDPFVPDGGDAQGRSEDDGAHYLLPYWMGRYHGFFVE